jgi:hypothetical protein
MLFDGFPAGHTRGVLFDGPPAELPIATLRSTISAAPFRRLRGALDRDLARRWAWLRPRAVPLIVAFAGMLATLAAVKYAGLWARSERMTLDVHTRISDTPPRRASADDRSHRHATEIVVRPLGIHDHYLVLTIDPPDAP